MSFIILILLMSCFGIFFITYLWFFFLNLTEKYHVKFKYCIGESNFYQWKCQSDPSVIVIVCINKALKLCSYPVCSSKLKALSFPRATASENCSLLGTDNDRGQISGAYFAPNGGCWFRLFILLHRRHALVVTQRSVEPNLSAAFHFKMSDKTESVHFYSIHVQFSSQ